MRLSSVIILIVHNIMCITAPGLTRWGETNFRAHSYGLLLLPVHDMLFATRYVFLKSVHLGSDPQSVSIEHVCLDTHIVVVVAVFTSIHRHTLVSGHKTGSNKLWGGRIPQLLILHVPAPGTWYKVSICICSSSPTSYDDMRPDNMRCMISVSYIRI